jgi:hypothetical protein
MTQTQTLSNLSIQSVTRRPKTVPNFNSDGVSTGWFKTLHSAIGYGEDLKPVLIPAGTFLSRNTVSGFDNRVGFPYESCSREGSHERLNFRAAR